MSAQTRWSRWTLRFLVLIGSLAVVLLSFEGLLWLTGVAPPILHFGSPRFYQVDSDLIYSMRPGGAVDTNAAGLRGPEVEQTLPGPRLIALGDSYTYGHLLDYASSYPALLEQRLNREKASGDRVHVINAGVKGYNVDQAYALFARQLSGLAPDAVILVVEPKDLAGSNVLYDIKDGELVPVAAWKNWIYLQLWVRTFAPKWVKETNAYRYILRRISGSDPFRTLPSDDLDHQAQWQIEKIALLIDRLVRTGKRDGFEVFVVNFPDRPALLFDGDYTKSTYFGIPVSILGPRGNEHMKNLGEAIRSTGAHYVDAMQIFLNRGHKATGQDGLYLNDDPHMSRRGNAVLAEIIADEVLRVIPAEQLRAR